MLGSVSKADLNMFAFGDKEWPGLAKLNEESGELVQVIGKLMMMHGAAKHWDGSDLRARLVEEVSDVAAALSFVEVYVLTAEEREAFDARRVRKLEQFELWHQDQRAADPLKAEFDRRVREETDAIRARCEVAYKALGERNSEIAELKREQKALVKALGAKESEL